jgi:quinol monooxygenase YgiN
MIVLAVVWQAKPGHESEVADLFRKLTEASRKEPGCLMYQVHRHKDAPARFFIYEQYKDEAALEAHKQTPHFLEYARKQLAPIADRLDGNLYWPLG